MKLKRLDRLALAVFALLVAMGLIFLFACAIAPDLAESAGAAFNATMLNYPALRFLAIVLCLTLAMLIAGGVWALLHRRDQKEEIQPVSLTTDEGGSVQIAHSALEALVRRAIGPVSGVDHFDVRLENAADALSVTLQMTVRQGTKIPELAQNARQNVREALEDMTGAKVDTVTLVVSDITADAQKQSDGKF